MIRAATQCSLTADYAAVQGDVILPFLFELNEEASLLHPGEGEYQRFCYDITASGEDTSLYHDLSHFVLGLCPGITADQFRNITVIRDGVEQEVVFGENVSWKTADNPDPTTGCPGLKFDFGLDKVDGEMRVCFELLTTYPVGPVRVCVKGGTTALTSLFICGPACETPTACGTVAYQRARVCVPVTVTPYAWTDEAQVYCCGDATVTPGDTPCPGTVGGSCTFTVSRTLCVAVPVYFGATTRTGEPSTDCLGASATEDCTDCGNDA